jgi:hypothetical protein
MLFPVRVSWRDCFARRPHASFQNLLLRQQCIHAGRCREREQADDFLLASKGDCGAHYILHRCFAIAFEATPSSIGYASTLGGFSLSPSERQSARTNAASDPLGNFGYAIQHWPNMATKADKCKLIVHIWMIEKALWCEAKMHMTVSSCLRS